MNGLLTTAEIAQRWGCSLQWVQALCKRGQLKAQLVGHSYVVREQDVNNYEHRSPGRPSQNGTRKHRAAKRSLRPKAKRSVRT